MKTTFCLSFHDLLIFFRFQQFSLPGKFGFFLPRRFSGNVAQFHEWRVLWCPLFTTSPECSDPHFSFNVCYDPSTFCPLYHCDQHTYSPWIYRPPWAWGGALGGRAVLPPFMWHIDPCSLWVEMSQHSAAETRAPVHNGTLTTVPNTAVHYIMVQFLTVHYKTVCYRTVRYRAVSCKTVQHYKTVLIQNGT
jgi:hypothetical protein